MSITKLLTSCRKFAKSEGGNAAVIFGLTAVPAFTLVGAGIDYSRAFSQQTFLQSLLDSATVAAVREYVNSNDKTKAENRLRDTVLAGLMQKSKGNMQFQCWIDPSSQEKDYEYLLVAANTTTPQTTTCTTTPPANIPPDVVVLKGGTFDTSKSMINPTLEVSVPTTALNLAGLKYIHVMASSTARLQGKKLEVALMADTTGSINESAGSMTKLAALKLAAKDMFSIFNAGLSSGATRIAVVPFAEGVNPGSYASAVRGSPASSKTFTSRNYNWYTGSYSSYTYQRTGCVVGRTGSNAMNDEPPSTQLYDALYNNSGTCAEASTILPLTSTKSVLDSKIDGLNDGGSTPGHIGTQWAWNMISPKWASVWGTNSAPAAYEDKDTMKAAILMTDGEYNLQFCQGVNDSVINCTDPNGDANAQAMQFCTNMKAQGITVYTIGFQIDQTAARNMLIDCASYSKDDPTKKLYYFPYSSDDIRAAFKDIGKQLAAGQNGVVMGQ